MIIVYIYRFIGVILHAAMNTWKVPLVVDISMVKNWSEVYWIIRRVKYTLFYWLIKEHWTLNYLWCGIERWVDVEFLRKGDFGLENFLWEICIITSSYLAKRYHIRQQNPPHLNIIMAIKKLLYFPHHLYYLFGKKSMWCNMIIT